jgi:hypothetical protein
MNSDIIALEIVGLLGRLKGMLVKLRVEMLAIDLSFDSSVKQPIN